MSFSEYIESISKGSASIQISEEWAQGRSIFGGFVAAVVYQAMLKELDDARPVRSLQISFVGPVLIGHALELTTEVLRKGKSVTQILGRGIQNGQTQITIVASFGHARKSILKVNEPVSKFDETPESIKAMPFMPGATPNFTRFFDFRYCTQFPFTGSSDQSLKGFVRFKDETVEIGNAELIALVDAWPPAPLSMLTTMSPASSLNWTIDFIKPLPNLSAGEFCQYQADIVHVEGGYGVTRAKVWNSSGELIAISQQAVTIFG
tara:strand:+ start:1442 stop:2230 length:789 start_codon:yes stop_codon:yes gene_type:complete